MPIDLGIGYDDAKKESGFEPLPAGTYAFMVESIEEGHTGELSKTPNRPKWTWRLKVVGGEHDGRTLLYTTVFPWSNPMTGQRDVSGLGLLVAIAAGIGAMWEGTILPDKETFYGRSGFMRVGTKMRRKADPMDADVVDNTIKIVVAKR